MGSRYSFCTFAGDMRTRCIDVLDQETETLQARISLAQAEREAMVAERELAARVGYVDVLATQAELVE